MTPPGTPPPPPPPRSPGPPPLPPAGRSPAGPAPAHPLATASVVLAVAGLAVPIAAGLVAAVLGAVARRLIAGAPGRWGGDGRAVTGTLLGLFTGAVPLTAVLLLERDDLGAWPLAAVLAYGAVVAVIAGPPGRAQRRVAGGGGRVGPGVGQVLLGGAVAVVFVVAILFMLQTVISAIGEEAGEAACSGL